MLFRNKNIAIALTIAVFAGSHLQVEARPNVNSGQKPGGGQQKIGQLKTTASTCKPAEARIDLDINNVRAQLMTGGDMWWDQGNNVPKYEVPKGSRKNSLFAGSVWIGGYTNDGTLKVAAQTYRQDGNDYWPGPLDNAGEITEAMCSEWDNFWKVDRTTVNTFRDMADKSPAVGDPAFDAILQWPAKGNDKAVGRNKNNLNLGIADKKYAPFVDVDNNGVYNPIDGGDYPDIDGDQFIWWVFNDKGNVKQQSQTEGIGIEVQASAFAYATKDALNDATFYRYKLINRGNLTLERTYIATWTDADLGYHLDDYIGCDTSRGLGILYNGRSVDGTGAPNHYGDHVPMVGIDFFQGPKKPIGVDSTGQTLYEELSMEAFTYYNNDFSNIGNPSNGTQIYNYMTGFIRNGEQFSYDFQGPGVNSKAYGAGFPATKYVYTGDPSNPSEWSECICNNPPADKRFVHSSGPFTLEPGVENDITIGAIWVSDVGGCPNTSFRKIRTADDNAQALFDNDFKTIEGPEAPRMVVKEMDRKLIFYLVNDPNSTNFQEKFGRSDSAKYRVASAKAAKYVHHPDSLYKFEGYRVFQVKNSSVTPAEIFNENGEVNNELAVEVFKCDVKNGVGRIINYSLNTDISDTTWDAVVKVDGLDSGIKHSFEISIDQFATGADKRLVNYRNYYFVAVAYAYNNFAAFNLKHADSTQDVLYLESQHGPNSSPIPVVAGMPNPANGDMGTVLNSNFGDGVIIKRMEGTGNGGRAIEMDAASEAEALEKGQVLHPTYDPRYPPVNVKIIDPLILPPHEWELYLMGDVYQEEAKGIKPETGKWKLVDVTTGEEIYSESPDGLETPNEQILEKYGLSVNISQTIRPGDDQTAAHRNGYITSSITFKDLSKPWLAGVNDGEQKSLTNWIRSGNNNPEVEPGDFPDCNFADTKLDTVISVYETLLSDYAFTKGTWAPYALGSKETTPNCGFGTVRQSSGNEIFSLNSVDVVFTDDKSKWSRCVVLEMQEDTKLAEGGVSKFDVRDHEGWNGEVDENGRPIYSDAPEDRGMSYFPGYAINQETGERLNIIFGEDSWLQEHNGNDMIWNPTIHSIIVDSVTFSSVYPVFGGKHVIYVLNSKYDECAGFLAKYNGALIVRNEAYKPFMYTGFPLLNKGYQFKSLKDGLIPTETRIKIRVTRPYAKYETGVDKNNGLPYYTFNTATQAPTPLSDNPNADKQALLDRINVVPNPYYGYTGYEINRLDTRVRIINLPAKATVTIYSLDGAMINQITKDNPNVSFVDWNIRNFKGLPIASGMYLVHVKADGIGETVIKWFGAMRPIDITTN